MNDSEWLAARFEDHRPRLRSVAYRMLGSLSEADDAVQDAWIRVTRADASKVDNLGGWLTTIVARVCLNMLRARNTRREAPLETHLPDPVVSPQDGMDPEQEALLADSVGLAMLVVLDALTPAERVAFVLHDVFAVPFDEHRSWAGRQPRHASLRAGHGAGCRARPSRTSTLTNSGPSSRPSSRRRGTVTSGASWRSLTRTSSCTPMAARAGRASSASLGVPRPSPNRR